MYNYLEETALDVWIAKHGKNPDNWPKPEGQAMTWDEWAKAVSDEATRIGHKPEWFPLTAAQRRDLATSCWSEDWLLGRTPIETIRDDAGI